MTGYPGDNRDAFRKASKFLREMGHKVTSPDELDEINPAASETWADMLTRDIPWLVRAEVGIALPGWRASKGATLEATILTSLGRPVYELHGSVRKFHLVPLSPDELPSIVHPVTVRASETPPVVQSPNGVAEREASPRTFP